MTDPVTLNVGGHLYTTPHHTDATRIPCLEPCLGDFPSARDLKAITSLIEMDLFSDNVLNFLRTSEPTLPLDFGEFDLLRKEADFYQIEP